MTNLTTLQMLDRAATVPDSPNIDPRVNAMRREGRAALRDYLTGTPPLAEVASSSQRVVVMPSHYFVFAQDGWEPVAAHRFMDRPGHARMSEAAYRALSPVERACVSARVALLEQFDGYSRLWLESYWPEVFRRLWEEEGVAQLAFEEPAAARERFAAEAEALRRPN